jgi:hypothetical protein
VDALAGPEGSPLAPKPGEATADLAPPPSVAGMRGAEPTTIIAEARQIAGHLEPLRHEWAELSPASRAQRLIDAVHLTLAKTGVPKPTAVLKKTGGGLFHQDTWIVEIDGKLLSKDKLSIEEFAAACEIARHEMEHAMQFFRMARREHARTGEDAKTLADRMHMPVDRVRDAVASNEGSRPAERMPEAGSAADRATAAQYENVYTNRKNRNEVLERVTKAADRIEAANERFMDEKDPVLVKKALDELQALTAQSQKDFEEYRNYPEEVPAFQEGAGVAAAVAQQARLADRLVQLRADERRAFASSQSAWNETRSGLADPTKRLSPVARAAVNRSVRQWLAAVDRVALAERELIRVLQSARP